MARQRAAPDPDRRSRTATGRTKTTPRKPAETGRRVSVRTECSGTALGGVRPSPVAAETIRFARGPMLRQLLADFAVWRADRASARLTFWLRVARRLTRTET